MQAVFAIHVAMIADEDDQRVLLKARIMQPAGQAGDLVIHARHQPIIHRPIGFLLFDQRWRHRIGKGHFGRLVHVLVPVGSRFDRTVRQAITDHGHERLLFGDRIGHELDHMVALVLRFVLVRLVRLALVVAVIDAMKIIVAPAVADERLKTQAVLGRDEVELVAPVEVPLAEPPRSITGLPHQLGQKGLPEPDGVMVGRHAVLVGVETGHQRSPERTTQWKRTIGGAETHATGGQCIDGRSADRRIAGERETVITQLVGIDQQDIRPPHRITPCPATVRGASRKDG